jgi:hypothetical protein
VPQRSFAPQDSRVGRPTRFVLFCGGVPKHLSANQGFHDLRIANLLGRDAEDILAEDDRVGEFARRDRALFIVLKFG